MSNSSRERAGAGMPTPALFFLAALAGFVLLATAANAIPKDEFPDPADKAKVQTEEGPSGLEQVVERATQELRAGKMGASAAAVDFALFVYSRSGDSSDRDRAASLATDLPGSEGAQALERVAEAGGTPPPYKVEVLHLFPMLQGALQNAAESGTSEARELFMAQVQPSRSPVSDPYESNPTAALALWKAGKMFGDDALMKRGKAIVEAMAKELPPDKPVDPALALAAAHMSTYPTQMVLIGDPADPTVTAMREACLGVFEPTKILISLDPATDRERIEELGYPPDMAPVLFVCVEALCSAPIQDPAKVPEAVAEIVKLSRSVAE